MHRVSAFKFHFKLKSHQKSCRASGSEYFHARQQRSAGEVGAGIRVQMVTLYGLNAAKVSIRMVTQNSSDRR